MLSAALLIVFSAFCPLSPVEEAPQALPEDPINPETTGSHGSTQGTTSDSFIAINLSDNSKNTFNLTLQSANLMACVASSQDNLSSGKPIF
jgi:hypothetical protein